MSDTLVILGAGGHAKVCYEIAVEMGLWTDYVILDDNPKNDFFEVSGKLTEFENYPDADFFVAIGSNEDRKNLFNEIKDKGYKIVTLLHPSAIISPTAVIGEGTAVMPGVIVNANATIGQGCILNTACSVDHDNKISDFVHISPSVALGGSVTIDELSWLGINSAVINNITITSKVTIGGNGVVVNDIYTPGNYVGVPVKRIE